MDSTVHGGWTVPAHMSTPHPPLTTDALHLMSLLRHQMVFGRKWDHFEQLEDKEEPALQGSSRLENYARWQCPFCPVVVRVLKKDNWKRRKGDACVQHLWGKTAPCPNRPASDLRGMPKDRIPVPAASAAQPAAQPAVAVGVAVDGQDQRHRTLSEIKIETAEKELEGVEIENDTRKLKRAYWAIRYLKEAHEPSCGYSSPSESDTSDVAAEKVQASEASKKRKTLEDACNPEAAHLLKRVLTSSEVKAEQWKRSYAEAQGSVSEESVRTMEHAVKDTEIRMQKMEDAHQGELHSKDSEIYELKLRLDEALRKKDATRSWKVEFLRSVASYSASAARMVKATAATVSEDTELAELFREAIPTSGCEVDDSHRETRFEA